MKNLLRTKTAKKAGFALITVMLISGIAALIAAKTTLDNQNAIRSTTNIIGSDQGLLYVYSVENWVFHFLAKDARESSADFPGEDWTTSVPPLPIEGGNVSGTLTDATARYNINNLIDKDGKVIPAEYERLARLLELLSLPSALADTITDWMDANGSARRYGAEDSSYSSLNPPYRTANQKLTDISELRLVYGMKPKYYNALKQHLTVLPLPTPVNANFANDKTLRMLDKGINAEVASEVIRKQNKKEAFRQYQTLAQTMQSFSEDPDLGKRINNKIINTATQFFRLETVVNYNDTQTRAISIIQRTNDKEIKVIYRILGAWADD